MIPKTIHYCWFGKNPKSKLAKKCIKSWRKICRDYRIIEWNEDNFDILSAPLYVRQAYQAKKWAFVTDYVRLKVVFDYGGIYFDTDVQVLKSFDEFLCYNAFFGFEETSYINTGLGFGAEKGSLILKSILNQYTIIPFILDNGRFNTIPCPQRNTEVFKEYGLLQNNKNQILDNNILILSSDYLCPISYETLKMRKTKNTHSIHWFNASWHTKEERSEYKNSIKIQRQRELSFKIKKIPNIALRRLIGDEKYQFLKNKWKRQ